MPITRTAQLLLPHASSLLSALPLGVSFLDTWMMMRERIISREVGPLDPLCYTAHQMSKPISPLLQHYQVLLKVNDEQRALRSM